MNILDLRTVLFSYVVSNAICSLVMASLWAQNRKRSPELGYWLAGFITQFFAIFFIVLRGLIPDFISIIIGNALLIAQAILVYIGLERYIGKQSSQIHNYVLLGIFVSVHVYFTYTQESLFARNLNISIALLFICSQCAWLMLKRVDAKKIPSTRMAGWIFIAYALVSLIRVAIDISVPQGSDLLASGIFDTLVILIYQMLFIALTFALFLMVNRRLFEALEKDIQERTLAEAALQKSEEKFSIAFQTIPDAIVISQISDGKIIEVNNSFFEMTELSKEEFIGKTTIELNLWADLNDRNKFFELLQQQGTVKDFETVFRKKSGILFPGQVSSKPIQLPEGACVLNTIRDITERSKMEAALRESEEHFRAVVQTATDAIITVDQNGLITAWNQGAQDIFHYTDTEIIGQQLIQLMPERYRTQHQNGMDRLSAGGEPHIVGQTVQVHGLHKDGSEFPMELVLSFYKVNKQLFFSGIIRDITERKKLEIALEYQSTHDILTGLFNRQYYEAEVEKLQDSRQFPISILMMDVDGLKRVNDSLGHNAGDDLLRGVARVLSNTFRPEDLVARIGGDEFVVVLPKTDDEAAAKVVQRIRNEVNRHNQVAVHGETISLSIGFACGDKPTPINNIFIQADAAMYRDKMDRKNIVNGL